MKAPSPVRVGPYSYRVELHDVVDGDGNAGVFLAEPSIVRIQKGMAPIRERETVLHELLHGVWDLMGLPTEDGKEEAVIRPLATGVLQVLRDNPRLVRYLTEDVHA